MTNKKYKVVSLFSGAMGLDIGLDKTGRFDLIACIELEKSFCETIRRNIKAGRVNGNPFVIEGDISGISNERFTELTGINPGEVDLIVGGPPCQAFSTAGRRQSVQDPRGTLLWQYLRFVEYLNPKFFLMENVRGILSAALKHRPISQRPEKGGAPLDHDELPGSVVRLFAEDLTKIKGGPYHMDCFEVNAVNYGAPQLRERALFIGNRLNYQVDFPEPTHGYSNASSDLFKDVKSLLPWRTLGDAIGDMTDPGDVIMDFSPRKKQFLSLVPSGANWRSLPVEVQQDSMGRAWHAKGGRSGWWRRLSFDLPCPTLVTMPNHASTSLCHPTEVRALSLREYARIQEFPDDWEFFGKTTEQYAQVGNAVPTRLGEVAGTVIADALDKTLNKDYSLKEQPLDSFRVIYIQSHIRTRQWFKGGKTFVWEDGSKKGDADYGAPVSRKNFKDMIKAK